MTNPGEPIAEIPTVQVMAMTRQLRAMLRVVEVMGLGQLTVTQLLDEVERLDRELAEQQLRIGEPPF